MKEIGKGGRGREEHPAPKGPVLGTCAYCGRQQGAESLKACFESRFECLDGVACEGIAIHQDGRLVYVNRPFAEMFGYQSEELHLLKLWDLIAPESHAVLNRPDPADRPIACEVTGVRKDGTRFPLEIHLREHRLASQVLRIVTCRNLTLQKQHEQQIEAILESSDDQIVVIDRNFIHLYINQAALRFIGMKREDVLGKSSPEVLRLLPDAFQVWRSRIEQTFETGKSARFEDEMEGADRLAVQQSDLFPIRYPNGEIFAVGIITRDITEQKRLQRQLEESEAKYRQLYIDSPIPLYRTRISDGKLLECNEAMARLAGFADREEFLNEVYVPDYYVDPSVRANLMARLRKEKRVEGYQFETYRKDGSRIWIELSAEIYPEQDYIEGTQRDVTAVRLLTKAEKRVLTLIHEGLSNKEIARRLNKSVRTIEDHRRNMMRKLSLDNIVDLINQTKSVLTERDNG